LSVDEKPPVVKEDGEYPDWLPSIAQKGATKAELMEKYQKQGIESLSMLELRRFKRLLGLEDIKKFNAESKSEKS
jgi:hypothetical protein